MTGMNNMQDVQQEIRHAAIFALDIGTRTVIGAVFIPEGENLILLAQYITEHQSRAVFDGQIHDIPRVTEAVVRVKSALEEELGFYLEKVAIAAAGRSLKTKLVKVEQDIDHEFEIDHILCRVIENDGIKKAHAELRDEMGGGTEDFYCVGYTVVNYYLNGYSITNLLGHRGKKIGAGVLATFLPDSVVSSLYAVLARAGLEPLCLTLEPIAASAAVIPESYRLLNLALVDIGAGTSDIAISRDGSIVAYGMVPLAGDEITEALAESCLVDFHTAERIKRDIKTGRDISYTDIMGMENTLPSQDALAIINPVLDRIAGEIVKEILTLNGGKSPKSVFCVGGGGQIPTLTEKIAAGLNLETNRVGLKTRSSIAGLKSEMDTINGPEGVTVVGIAKVAEQRVGQDFITILINGRENKLFHSRELTVYDAMGLIEYSALDLVGNNGKDLKITLNNKKKIIYGGLRQPAEILVNGQKASIKTALKNGDMVEIIKARDGEDARACVADLTTGCQNLSVYYDGKVEILKASVTLNGSSCNPETELKDGDQVLIQEIKTAGQLARMKNIDLSAHDIYVNAEQVSPDYLLVQGDRVEFQKKKNLNEVSQQSVVGKSITVSVNGSDIKLAGKEHYIFVDIFNHIDFELSYVRSGCRVDLLINGRKAGYTDPLQNGDVVEVSVR